MYIKFNSGYVVQADKIKIKSSGIMYLRDGKYYSHSNGEIDFISDEKIEEAPAFRNRMEDYKKQVLEEIERTNEEWAKTQNYVRS